MYAQNTQIHPLVFIRRNRVLPVPGVVNVRIGQKVDPMDVVASVEIPTRHYLVDVFHSLGTRTAADAENLIGRKPGDLLEKNDIIAETGGLFSRVIRTPGPGKLITITGGRVLIEAGKRTLNKLAGMSGVVTQIVGEVGAVIETNGTLVQGVWGNNQAGSGTLIVRQESVDGELVPANISLEFRGTVLIAGCCNSAEALAKAASEGIKGLILGSMSSSLIATAESQSYPIIVLSGFGKFGLDSLSKKILVSNAGREVAINAVKWDRITGDRPEIIISLPSNGEPYSIQTEFAVGQIVRVHASEHLGKVGVAEKIIPGLTRLPSGLRASAAAVKFENGERGILPLANLDVLHLSSEFLETNDGGG